MNSGQHGLQHVVKKTLKVGLKLTCSNMNANSTPSFGMLSTSRKQ